MLLIDKSTSADASGWRLGAPRRRTLGEALREAGLEGEPAVTADEPPVTVATTVHLPRRAEALPLAFPQTVAPFQSAAVVEDERQVEAFRRAVPSATVERDAPVPPFLRRRRPTHWRETLANGVAWFATCVFVAALLSGAGYFMAAPRAPQPPPLIIIE